MGNPYPVRVRSGDVDGVTVIVGELDFSDPANQPSGPTPTLADVLAAGDDAGALKIVNLAAGTDPNDAVRVAQLPAAYVPPITQERFQAATAVAPAGSTVMTWTKVTGDDLVDLTDPTQPAIITAGVYVLSCTVGLGSSPSPGDHASAGLGMNVGGVALSASGGIDLGFPLGAECCLGGGWYCIAGGVLLMEVQHSANGSLNFGLTAGLQRIS